MQRGFRTINPRRVRKPNNLNAISHECRSVWNEPGRERREEAGGAARGGGEEVKEVETPKSNVKNTTRAEARVKRYGRSAGERSERTERAGKIFRTLNSRYRKRDIGVRRNNRRILCSFRESRPKSPAIPYRTRDRIVTTTIPLFPPPPPLVLPSALRALECSISDTRTTLNPAQWRGCNAI